MPSPRRRPLSDAPDSLPPEARARLREWARSHLPWGDQRIGRSWAECRDWHRAQGVLRADWEAAFRNWLRKELEFQQRDAPGSLLGADRRRRPVSSPYRPGSASQEPLERISCTMADVIPLFREGEG